MAYNFGRRELLLSNQTASGSASIIFTSVISTEFSVYVLKIRDLVAATNATNLLLTLSTDNGSTYLSTNYKYSSLFSDSTAASGNLFSSDSATFIEVATTVSNVSSRGYSADIMLFDFNSGFTPNIAGFSVLYTSGTRLSHVQFTGCNTGTTAITAIKLVMSAGNITSGTFRLYGVVET